MPKYKNADIAQLAHQLTLSPRRQRLSQIAGAERMLEIVDANKDYPYDFVCYHLTGYRPLKPSRRPALRGAVLISDLVRLIEHLSQSASIPLEAISDPVQTQEQLSQRLSVSMKTIARWRQRGLSGLRVVDADRVSRLIFTERSLQRFVANNRDLVVRGGAFRQLTAAERTHIVRRAAELVAEQRVKLQEAARIIAEETNRAVETIRYTLRRHDRANPNEALFGAGGRPRVPDNYAQIYAAHRKGTSIRDLALAHKLPRKKVERIFLEMSAYELLSRKITCVFHPSFDAPDANARILGAAEPEVDESGERKVRPPADAPAYLKALYEVRLLTQPQEQDLFKRYNYCKYRTQALIQGLEPCSVTRKQLQEIARFQNLADRYQQRIIQANLRLVVSIANRHMRRGINLFELISDGNMSLLRAVERFDFSRGYKFSTYASWAIMKNFARTIPEERSRYTRYVTGRDELLDVAPAHGSADAVHAPSEAAGLRAALAGGLAQLGDREREILSCHFGLAAGGEPTTLEQLGSRFGVTKERIRQIEKRALAKLRKILPPSLADHAGLL